MPTPTNLQSPAAILLWDQRLRGKKCEPITEFGPKLRKLIEQMQATCYAYNGAGLAAPQINEFVRVAVIHVDQEKPAWVIINPEIDATRSRGEQVGYEACLSIPTAAKVNVHVRRCMKLAYSYQDLDGHRIEAEAEGFLARAIAHECDHLDGYFYTDRIGELSRSLVMRSHQKWLSANLQLGAEAAEQKRGNV